MPLPTMRVVPLGWSAHHRPVSEGGMNAACIVSVPNNGSLPAWDPALDDYVTPERSVLYAGPCRVAADLQATRADQGEQGTSERRYTVALPTSFEAAVGSSTTVHMTEAPNDVGLVGRLLYVISDQFGSEAFERVLQCSDTLDPGVA